MGLFDEIYITEDVSDSLDLKCTKCGELLCSPWDTEPLQTKDLECAMYSYIMEHDPTGIRMHRLGRYKSEVCVVLSEEDAKSDDYRYPSPYWLTFGKHLEAGELGVHKDKATIPNRIREITEGRPHAIIGAHTICKCGYFVDVEFKFTDGVLVGHKVELGSYLGDLTPPDLGDEEIDPPLL
jgi:hypothetical protein